MLILSDTAPDPVFHIAPVALDVCDGICNRKFIVYHREIKLLPQSAAAHLIQDVVHRCQVL